MGSLQGLLGKANKFAIEADDLQEHDSLNADVRNDRIKYNTTGHQQITFPNDGVGSTIIGWKSYNEGRACCTHHQEAKIKDYEVDEVGKF